MKKLILMVAAVLTSAAFSISASREDISLVLTASKITGANQVALTLVNLSQTSARFLDDKPGVPRVFWKFRSSAGWQCAPVLFTKSLYNGMLEPTETLKFDAALPAELNPPVRAGVSVMIGTNSVRVWSQSFDWSTTSASITFPRKLEK